MARPPMPIGTHGELRAYPLGPRRWHARVLVRDHDGVIRHVERAGRTKGESVRRLSEALRDRVHLDASEDLHPDSAIRDLSQAWHDELAREGRAAGTPQQYRRHLDRVLLPRLGAVRVRELSVARCSTYFRTIEEEHGASTAKMSKSVLSGISRFAAQRDLIDRNPTREAGAISTKTRNAPRALTLDQVRDLRVWLTYDNTAIRRDLPDFVAFMLATGLRISEASAVQWRNVDLDAGTVHVNGNVVRIKGKGLVLQHDESGKLTRRTLQLPTWCIELLRRRRQGRDVRPRADAPVFPSPSGALRDPSNTQADLKEAFAFCGYPWVTSHVFRRTVASLMDHAGLSARAAADQLGHAQPSMTLDKYVGRRADTGAATVLDALDLG